MTSDQRTHSQDSGAETGEKCWQPVSPLTNYLTQDQLPREWGRPQWTEPFMSVNNQDIPSETYLKSSLAEDSPLWVQVC